jgi:hypothetical protein
MTQSRLRFKLLKRRTMLARTGPLATCQISRQFRIEFCAVRCQYLSLNRSSTYACLRHSNSISSIDIQLPSTGTRFEPVESGEIFNELLR